MNSHQKPTLYLHIGMHKTGTTFVQNIFRKNREYLLENEGLFFPDYAGVQNGQETTRSGANSGHGGFTQRRIKKNLFQKLRNDCEKLQPKSVFISSENFTIWRRKVTPKQYLERFNYFDRIVILLVLRRQDQWIESYYKQILDGYIDFETRSIEQFCNDTGDRLFDYQSRFDPWRQSVGVGNFLVGSYDDIVANDGIMNWFGNALQLSPETQNHLTAQDAPKYPSASGINSFGLRMLNQLVITNKSVRTKIVRDLYSAGEHQRFDLLPHDVAKNLRERYQKSNEWIAQNWFSEPVPEFSNWDTLHFAPEPIPHVNDPNLTAKLDSLAKSIEAHCGNTKRVLAFRNIEDILNNAPKSNSFSKRLQSKNNEIHRKYKLLQARLSNSSKRFLISDIFCWFRKQAAKIWRYLFG